MTIQEQLDDAATRATKSVEVAKAQQLALGEEQRRHAQRIEAASLAVTAAEGELERTHPDDAPAFDGAVAKLGSARARLLALERQAEAIVAEAESLAKRVPGLERLAKDHASAGAEYRLRTEGAALDALLAEQLRPVIERLAALAPHVAVANASLTLRWPAPDPRVGRSAWTAAGSDPTSPRFWQTIADAVAAHGQRLIVAALDAKSVADAAESLQATLAKVRARSPEFSREPSAPAVEAFAEPVAPPDVQAAEVCA